METVNNNSVHSVGANDAVEITYVIQTPDLRKKYPCQNIEIISRSTHTIKLVLMCLLTMQQIALPLLVRFARQQNTGYKPTVLVFITEAIKLMLCSAIITIQNGSVVKFATDVYTHVVCNITNTLKTCIPAVAYALQNNLYYIALHNINAAQYTAMYQMRILTTAVVSVIMLKRNIVNIQWLALLSLVCFCSVHYLCYYFVMSFLLIEFTHLLQNQILLKAIGVIMVQLPQTLQRSVSSTGGVFIVGIIAVFLMCWTSAFAGVYFEKVLKKSVLDMWMENVRLGLMTLIFATFTMLASDGQQIQRDGLFHGWTKLIWSIAILNAVGGLVVSAVMKYTDNIKKTLCQSLAIACTSALSVITNDAQANPLLFCGIFLVVLSTYVYSVESDEM